MGSDERRISNRYESMIPVTIGGGEPFSEQGSIADVSERGFFLRCDRVQPLGSDISVVIDTGSFRHVLRGRVMWRLEGPPKGPGMGIELTDDVELSVRTMLKLSRLL